jgi:prevent-host-death family protein
VSDLRNKFPEIESVVNEGEPVYLTKNGYGVMVVMSLAKYAETMDEHSPLNIALASEKALSKDWLLPEEDEAWANL